MGRPLGARPPVRRVGHEAGEFLPLGVDLLEHLLGGGEVRVRVRARGWGQG